jgi:hypothetical protein
MAIVAAGATAAATAVDQRATGRATVTRPSPMPPAPSDLGTGVKTKRRFCDVVIAIDGPGERIDRDSASCRFRPR